METKLERIDHTALACKRLSSELEQVSSPVRSITEWYTRQSMSSAVSSLRSFDLRIAETVHGESWLPPSIGAVGGVDIALLATA